MMTRTKYFYDLLLAYALVEIRALDDSSGLDEARRIADIFHNVPEALVLEWTAERERRMYEQMHEKAQVHGLTHMLERWERRAERRIAAGTANDGTVRAT